MYCQDQGLKARNETTALEESKMKLYVNVVQRFGLHYMINIQTKNKYNCICSAPCPPNGLVQILRKQTVMGMIILKPT